MQGIKVCRDDIAAGIVAREGYPGRRRKAYDHRTEERVEELVVAVIPLAQVPGDHVALKVQLYSSLFLDLQLWSSCSYGLQKKL